MFINTDFLKNEEIQLMLEKVVEGNEEKGWVPTYHFAICNNKGIKMGVCDLRIGHNEKLYYGGNIGYNIDTAYRGNHYAGKACILLFELARNDIVNIGLHFFLKNVRPYAAFCCEA